MLFAALVYIDLHISGAEEELDKKRQAGNLGIYFCRGSSVVEQKPEELRVDGSIPSLGTKIKKHSPEFQENVVFYQ